jgi:hypothetical protein
MVWAAKKCANFIEGLPRDRLEMVTDHKPLVPIVTQYSLSDIPNKRLQRLRAKLDHLQFSLRWVPSKENEADVLSRYPVSRAGPADEIDELDDSKDDALNVAICQLVMDQESASEGVDAAAWSRATEAQDQILKELEEAAENDKVYKEVREMIQRDQFTKADLPEHLKIFRRYIDRLHVDRDGFVMLDSRLFIPESMRKEMLEKLIGMHQGVEKMKARARMSIWWPLINNDIRNVSHSCDTCREKLPLNPVETERHHEPATFPFQFIHADLASCEGREFLIIVDQFSGWPEVFDCGRTASTASVTDKFRELFARFGAPVTIYTDGGPQFRDEFGQFCKEWKANHVTSSPNNPRSNGLAEANVGAMKKQIAANYDAWNRKLSPQFTHSMLLFRNTARKPSGLSPAQILFGQPLRDSIPMSRAHMLPSNRVKVEERLAQVRGEQQKSGQVFRNLSLLTPGTNVWLQHRQRWTRKAEVVSFGRNDREYWVRDLALGKMYRRNRRFLRPILKPTCGGDSSANDVRGSGTRGTSSRDVVRPTSEANTGPTSEDSARPRSVEQGQPVGTVQPQVRGPPPQGPRTPPSAWRPSVRFNEPMRPDASDAQGANRGMWPAGRRSSWASGTATNRPTQTTSSGEKRREVRRPQRYRVWRAEPNDKDKLKMKISFK